MLSRRSFETERRGGGGGGGSGGGVSGGGGGGTGGGGVAEKEVNEEILSAQLVLYVTQLVCSGGQSNRSVLRS